MTSKKVYLTKEGSEKLQKELKYLTEHKRKEVIKRIQEAKEYGDLSENAEYENAKNEQSFVEGRIAEIQKILKNATLIDQQQKVKGIVGLGSKVTIEVEGEKEEYTIVGAAEADPTLGKISNESAVGQALLGKKMGDVVSVETPGGQVEYKIKKVE